MSDIVERLNIARESLEAGCDDWPIASQIWEYKTAASEIESLRQQLSMAASEILALQAANKECVEYFNESQEDLAASQAREQKLRDHIALALEFCDIPAFSVAENLAKALAIPQDTSALEAVVQKAGEVVLLRCLSEIDPKYYTHDLLKEVVEGCCGDLRSLHNVTLEDLK